MMIQLARRSSFPFFVASEQTEPEPDALSLDAA